MSAIDVLLREFRGDRISRYKLDDEQWRNLNNFDRAAYFLFNATKPDPNDPNKRIKDVCTNGESPAYKVQFGGSDHDPMGISIAFYRCGEVSDSPKGFGVQVFMGVLKAVKEYIDARNPVAFNWSPVRRRGGLAGKTKTPEARKVIYEHWAINNMFPKHYVSLKENEWVRRDIYDRSFVQHGYPKVPEDIDQETHTNIKENALTQMRVAVNGGHKLQGTGNPGDKIVVYDRHGFDELGKTVVDSDGKFELVVDSHDDVFFATHTNSAGITSEKRPVNTIVKVHELNYNKRREAEDKYQEECRKEKVEAQIQRARKKAESMRHLLDNPELNPEKLEVGDVVLLPSDLKQFPQKFGDMDLEKYIDQQYGLSGYKHFHLHGKDAAKILDVDEVNPPGSTKPVLVAKLAKQGDGINDFTSSAGLEMPLFALKKRGEDTEEERRKRQDSHAKKYLEDARTNPQGLKVGDKIIAIPEFKASRRYGDAYYFGFGAIGKIKAYRIDYGDIIFTAEMDDNVIPSNEQESPDNFKNRLQEINFNATEKFIHLYNSENVQKVKSIYEEQKNALTNAIRSPQKNPQGFKVGDEGVYHMNQVERGRREYGPERNVGFGSVFKIDSMYLDDHDNLRIKCVTQDKNVLDDHDVEENHKRHLSNEYNDFNLDASDPKLKKLSSESIDKVKEVYNKYKNRHELALSDTQQNPQGFKVGDAAFLLPDKVISNERNYGYSIGFGQTGKIDKYELDNRDRLRLHFKSDDGNIFDDSEIEPVDKQFFVPERELEFWFDKHSPLVKKKTEGNLRLVKQKYEEHKNLLQTLLQDANQNPQKLELGDEVFFLPEFLEKEMRSDYGRDGDRRFGYGSLAKVIGFTAIHSRLHLKLENLRTNLFGDEAVGSNYKNEYNFNNEILASKSFIFKNTPRNAEMARAKHEEAKNLSLTYLNDPEKNKFGLELEKEYIFVPKHEGFIPTHTGEIGLVGKLKSVSVKPRYGSSIPQLAFIFNLDDQKSIIRTESYEDWTKTNEDFDRDNIKPVLYSDEAAKKLRELLKKAHIRAQIKDHREKVSKKTPMQKTFDARRLVQDLIDSPKNPQKIGQGDVVKMKTGPEIDAISAQEQNTDNQYRTYRYGREAGRQLGKVVNLQSTNSGVYAVVTPGRTAYLVQYLDIVKPFATPQVLSRLQRAERLRALHHPDESQGLFVGTEPHEGAPPVRNRRIGEHVQITGGPHSGKTGHIIGWKVSGNSVSAQVALESEMRYGMYQGFASQEDRVSVAIRNLRPIDATGAVAGGAAELRPEHMTFMNYLNLTNMYFG